MKKHSSSHLQTEECFFFSARCPVGKYYDSDADDCLLCPEGTYSQSAGALQCTQCPEGTWTVGSRSENFTSCIGKYKLVNIRWFKRSLCLCVHKVAISSTPATMADQDRKASPSFSSIK